MSATEQIIPSERWLPIPGYEGCYEVSDHGNVRSLDRVGVLSRKGFKSVPRRYKGRNLNPSFSHGYPVVALGKGNLQRVHRLVLLAFVGPCPGGMLACHNDSSRSNNNLNNLRWDTQSGNLADALALFSFNGSGHYRTNLTDEMVLEIYSFATTREFTQNEVGAMYGTTRQAVCGIISGGTWKHLNLKPVKWKRRRGFTVRTCQNQECDSHTLFNAFGVDLSL